jgi:23S rRNA pseudouridine2605 synthase
VAASPPRTEPPKGERIAKRLARAGLCSRRDAERWIAEGRVKVDGRVIDTPAVLVTDASDIAVDGQRLPQAERARLWRYHKPPGLIVSARDPQGRPTVFESLPGDMPRVVAVGRLDFNSEGLLLLTNDGGLARELELPANGWTRRYRARAHGRIEQADLDGLAQGVEVEGVRYGPVQATIERVQKSNLWISIALAEGKNREVRKLLSHVGLEVNRLIRVAFGPFALGDLAEGQVSELPQQQLMQALGRASGALAERAQGWRKSGWARPQRRDKPQPGSRRGRHGGEAKERP